MFAHLEFTFSAFRTLWHRRQFTHITIAEIGAFARIYSVYDVERFATLVMYCDQTVHEVQIAVEEEKEGLEKLTKLKGN